MAVFGIILLVLLIIVIVSIVSIYNSLVRLRNAVKNQWSQIDVQLKRRHDLIPNLVETAKGYMKHERETLENVTEARSRAMNAGRKGDVQDVSQAEAGLNDALAKFLMTVEAYPDLKANDNFMAVHEELTSTENKIGFARQAYNDQVMTFNNKIEMFPSNIIAGMFNFEKSDFFEIEDAEERKVPGVNFSS